MTDYAGNSYASVQNPFPTASIEILNFACIIMNYDLYGLGVKTYTFPDNITNDNPPVVQPGASGSGPYYATQYLNSSPSIMQSCKMAWYRGRSLSATGVIEGGGFSGDGPAGRGGMFGGPNVSVADVHDGTANTLMIGEKYVDSLHYLDGTDDGDNWPGYTGQGNQNVRCCVDNNHETGMGWLPIQDYPGYIKGRIFGSPHAGMLNAAFADGSVHQINYGISAPVYKAIGNRNDGTTVDASALFY
jgi:prepilin-type processing-associated H-X9-DG protein